MVDEARKEETEETEADEATEVAQTEEALTPKPKKGKKKLGIVVGVIAVIAVLGAGLWVWHEQPEFCGAVCHDAMSDYVSTYAQPANTAGTDKWGNDVSNTNAMLAVSHREQGENCLACHVPTIGQQLGEVSQTIAGDYYIPLDEVGTEQLMVNSGHAEGTGDEFCLKSGCHVTADGAIMTRDDLKALTADRSFNPHNNPHGKLECSDCHKSHRASVYTCTECHNEPKANMPAGWVDASTGEQLKSKALV